ncbi:hypothetical protein [Streptomyces lomondensis]|uniref:hypothetical protein n=1 Tax=Streptomyces lomondensis TaxID=68229 RepID=UPI0016743137|nr:hypothetical protein [Streptomyces lomondensis]MCF0077435.1 hypothetical protein [Streptomyces lomondensis]
MSSRSYRTAAVLIALPLLLAGCTGADREDPESDDRAEKQPSVKVPALVFAPPRIDSANDRPLPLDKYLVNPEQQSIITKAYARLVSDCMARFGFEYKIPTPQERRDSDAPTTRVSGHYGHQNSALMAKWGYHPEGGVPVSQSGAADSIPKVTAKQRVAERGTSDPRQSFGPGGQVIRGRTVPNHGCIGAATERVTGTVDGELLDPQIAVNINLETMYAARQDERTRSVFVKWSLCMKNKGLNYKDPLAAISDPEWQKSLKPTAHELKVATADAACRHKENVVGVWYAVDYAYEKQALAANVAAMAKVRADLESKVRIATQVMAE